MVVLSQHIVRLLLVLELHLRFLLSSLVLNDFDRAHFDPLGVEEVKQVLPGRLLSQIPQQQNLLGGLVLALKSID